MRMLSIVTTGVICMILSGVSSAGYLMLQIDIATEVDRNKVDNVGVESTR